MGNVAFAFMLAAIGGCIAFFLKQIIRNFYLSH